MAKYADWYAVELDGYLRGRVSEEQRFESVKEIMNHLAEHVDELVAKGMGQVDAEKAAIKTFGSPRDAALNLMNQGSRWRFGGVVNTFAAVAMMVGMVITTVGFQAFSLKLPYSYPLQQAVLGAIGGVIALSLIGSLISRKVEIRKYAFAWMAGLILSAGYLFAGPEKHFANIPPNEFARNFALWKEGNASTLKVAAIHEKVINAFGQASGQYYYGENTNISAEQKAAALKVISEKVPDLLKIKPSYIQLGGKLTLGYLVPSGRNAMDNYYYRTRYSYDFDGAFKPPTGEVFPWTTATMKYVKTPEEAIEAWRTSLINYSGLRDFGMMAQMQKEFLVNAEMIAVKTKTEMAWATLLPLSGSSLLYVLMMIFGSWLTSKVPNLTFHSSFRRRLA